MPKPTRTISTIIVATLAIAAIITTALTLTNQTTAQPAAADDAPIKALLITGGCCHDYPYQAEQLTEFANEHANVQWTVVNEGGNGTRAQIDLYQNPNWAEGYDVVVHNECFADTTDEAYIKSITNAHKQGVPAVVIHCAMHTYRSVPFDDWRQFLGVTSRRHDHQSRYPVTLTQPDHPTMAAIKREGWTSPMDELYIIDKTWPTATPLATSVSEDSGQAHPVFWINQFGDARVFGTTYGHSNATFADPIFLETVTRGIQWAAGRL